MIFQQEAFDAFYDAVNDYQNGNISFSKEDITKARETYIGAVTEMDKINREKGTTTITDPDELKEHKQNSSRTFYSSVSEEQWNGKIEDNIIPEGPVEASFRG